MELILKNHWLSFHDSTWRQLLGAAMGSKQILANADTFMRRAIDPKMIQLSEIFNKNGAKAMPLLKHFLDDYFSLFIETKLIYTYFWMKWTKSIHK